MKVKSIDTLSCDAGWRDYHFVRGWRPDFGVPFTPEPNVERDVLRNLVMPARPGWGIEPNEAAICARPPKGPAGLLNYGRKL